MGFAENTQGGALSPGLAGPSLDFHWIWLDLLDFDWIYAGPAGPAGFGWISTGFGWTVTGFHGSVTGFNIWFTLLALDFHWTLLDSMGRHGIQDLVHTARAGLSLDFMGPSLDVIFGAHCARWTFTGLHWISLDRHWIARTVASKGFCVKQNINWASVKIE